MPAVAFQAQTTGIIEVGGWVCLNFCSGTSTCAVDWSYFADETSAKCVESHHVKIPRCTPRLDVKRSDSICVIWVWSTSPLRAMATWWGCCGVVMPDIWGKGCRGPSISGPPPERVMLLRRRVWEGDEGIPKGRASENQMIQCRKC